MFLVEGIFNLVYIHLFEIIFLGDVPRVHRFIQALPGRNQVYQRVYKICRNIVRQE